MPRRYCPGSKSGRTRTTLLEDEPYNIILVHNLLADHPSLCFPEVQAVASTLRAVRDLRLPPHGQWHLAIDLLDWLAIFFCFQHENFKNQREHLVLHLANSQMRLSPLPENIDTLDAGVLRTFCQKLLKNYTNWCFYLGKKSNVWISKSGHSNSDHSRELLYVGLYLLIWGESANLWFMPECICYIFHHMTMELNKILEDYIDENTGQPVMPSLSRENTFLHCVVKPIYETVKAEAAIILAWGEKGYPWQALTSNDVRVKSQRSHDRRWSAEAGKRVVFFLLVPCVYVLPELLALALFVLPWGLREGLVDNIKYTLFWALGLWHKISKNEYRHCAMIEAYDSIKHIMLEILNARSEEHSVFAVLFHEIDHSIEIEKFTKTFKMTSLPQIHLKLIQLVEILTKPKKDASQVVYILQALYEIAVRDFFKDQRTIEQLREDGLAPRDPAAMAGLLFEKAVKLPDPNEKFYRQVRRLHTILTSRDSMQNIPVNLEARWRITFFSNSLFMNIPHAPQVEKMMAFSVLTLYYKEEDDEIWTTKLRDLKLWASYRGQTLFQIVRGMMYYYRALKMLAFLDSASKMDIRERIRELGSVGEDVSLDGFNSKVYMGLKRTKKDPHAEEILYLMKHNEALQVSYVDKVSVRRDEKEYYSVLVKYDKQLQKEMEIYRVQLPGPLKLGEGKPENQNHAIIFTRGDAIQTIDMNQDNYFDEALKMRNLLEEYKHYYGMRKPTILGVREHIFTSSVSSLACHPDVFKRFWFLTRGGISKVSRVVNISEDIFAGFNCTLRGGNVSHHEYIQVGKGRDVGLNQILMFEAKVASGNGELYLALSGVEIVALVSNNNNNKALSAILNQQFIIQLGIFTTLPMKVENSLEHGFLQAIWDFLTVQLQLSSVFYTFSMGTCTHLFGWTVLHGGAKYRGTSRGFVVQHKSFAENYRLYARSNFIKAIEFGLILTIYGSHSPVAKDTFVYIAMTISSWFLVLSWIMAPFVFNPSGFDWLKTVDDFNEFMNWIWYHGGVFAKAEQSWEQWWYEEQDHLRTIGLWGKILEIVLDLWFFFFQHRMVYQLGIAANSTSLYVYLLS
ncbi:hypothetical protein Goshw_024409 [Gossypium schwendimanii]|uniref:1,3-beta-glucan synthase n=1 Tax=Gossypium schwendimanii TaxID=34291 RepID=A0A7J9NBD4_GOSSC|nr:hypothetical protein [Gossypium schwendimanii]